MHIVHTKTDEAFCDYVNSVLVRQAQQNIEDKGRFTLLLSGGKTPSDVFSHHRRHYLGKMDWTKTHVFWVDERVVPSDHPESNFGNAGRPLLDHVGMIGSVNPIRGELSPEDAAINYQNTLGTFFGGLQPQFDFALLGMGLDGHVASVFPESPEAAVRGHAVLATVTPHNGFRRVTLSLSLIDGSSYKLLMARENQKLRILFDQRNKKPIHSIGMNEVVTR